MNIYGVRGFPTPDAADESHCRNFVIPNSTLALAVFMGALFPLQYEENWFQYGDMTPAEAAAMFETIIANAYDDDEGICPVIPAPYWDDATADDADDEFPEGVSQPWYGELVAVSALLPGDSFTWQENASIWLITAFLAITGNIGAAIAFVPIAHRFVLAFKQHDLGGIVRVFVDASQVGTVDTYAPSDGVANYSVFIPDDGESHTLWVEMSEDTNPAVEGTPSVQVIRKRLDEGEVYPTNMRYDATTDTVQQTYDGGATWVDNPSADPRTNPANLIPPPTGSDPRCQAAANMVAQQKGVIDAFLLAESELGVGLDLLGLATILMALFEILGPFAILFDLCLALAALMLDATATAVNAAFTTAVYDALLCIYDCTIAPDGTVSAAQFTTVKSKVDTELTGIAKDVMDAILFLIGQVGLQNEGAQGDAPADCSACDATFDHTDDFSTGMHGWYGNPANFGGSPTHFGGHIGGGSGAVTLIAQYTFTGFVTITDVYIDYAVDDIFSLQPTCRLLNGSDILAQINAGYPSGGNHAETFHFDFSPGVGCTTIQIEIDSNCVCLDNLYSVRVKGECSDPFSG